MTWTNKFIADLDLPTGKTKVTSTDPETTGLMVEVRITSRRFFYRYSIGGRTKTIPIGKFPVISVADARKRANDLSRQIMMGYDPLEQKRLHRSIPTISHFFKTYYIPFSKHHHRSTLGNESLYRHHIGPRVGQKRMDQITKLMVRQWFNDLSDQGYSPSMINRIMILFGQLYTLANELDVDGVPPRSTLGIKLLRDIQRHNTHLSSDEVKRLAAALDVSPNRHLKFIISFLLMTGARRSEAVHAKWDHINFSTNTWVVPLSKSGQPRHIYLSHAAVRVLEELRSSEIFDPDNAYIFPNPRTHKPFSCLHHSWKLVREAAGLPDLRIHDLRHSYASTLVNNGVSIYEVQQLLGHNSIKTTQRYAHLSSEKLFKSVAVADGTYGNALGIS